MTKKMVNVTMYGDGSQKSIITGSKNFVDGVRTFQTATFGMIVSKLISNKFPSHILFRQRYIAIALDLYDTHVFRNHLMDFNEVSHTHLAAQ